MIQANLHWNQGALEAAFEAGWEGIRRATAYFWAKLQEVLNVPNPLGPGGYTNSSKAGEAPRKRTGHGAAAVIFELDKKNLTSRTGVTQNGRYMLDLELGTKPYTIVARNKKALHFKINGKDVFVRKVNHPGLAPRPWFISTLKKILPQLKALAEGAGKTP